MQGTEGKEKVLLAFMKIGYEIECLMRYRLIGGYAILKTQRSGIFTIMSYFYTQVV